MSLEQLIREAARGNGDAWREIVRRFDGLVWASARSCSLSTADAEEVAQTTWSRLVENIDRIREPDRLGGWLATTVRNECIRLARLRGRELPNDDADVFEAPSDDAPDLRLLADERDRALWRAYARLSALCQTLLGILTSDAELSYEEISTALDMPIGSIGPTRMRCLARLRAELELEGGTA